MTIFTRFKEANPDVVFDLAQRSEERDKYLDIVNLKGQYAVVIGVSPNLTYTPTWFSMPLLVGNAVKYLLNEKYGDGSAKLVCEVDDDFWYGECGALPFISQDYSDENAGRSMLLAVPPSIGDMDESLEFEENLKYFMKFFSEEDTENISDVLDERNYNNFAEFGEEIVKKGVRSISEKIGRDLSPDSFIRMSELAKSGKLNNYFREILNYPERFNPAIGIEAPNRSLMVPVCDSCGNTYWKTMSSRLDGKKIEWKCKTKTDKRENAVTKKSVRLKGCGAEGVIEIDGDMIDLEKYPVGNMIRAPLWALFSWPSSSFQAYGAWEYPKLMGSAAAICAGRKPIVCSPSPTYDPEFGEKPGEEVSALRLLEKYGTDKFWEIMYPSLKLQRWV